MSWMKVTLAEICKSISDGDHQPPPKASKGIPFVTIANITNTNQFDFSDTMFVPYEYYEALDEKRRAQIGDILYSVVGSFGIPVLIKSEKKFVFQRHIAILRPDDNRVIPEFLYYTMLSRKFYMKADAVALGAAQRTVSLTSLRGLEIDLPDLDTQKKIVSILRPYDELIDNNQKQIALLEEFIQRLYKEWFIDFNYSGSKRPGIVNGLPEGWSRKSIVGNDIFKFVKSKVLPFEGEKQYFATADVVGTTFVSDGETITYLNRPSRAAVQPIVDSVWFARMSNTYKIINCFGKNEHLANDSVISSGFAGFTSEKEYYGFVFATITSQRFNDEKNRYATGATQVSLTNEGLKNIEVIIPTKEIIKKF
ncbi:MAG: restriction endonuclease subunit S [Lachnospiraceae bacterium]|nr:restriction endonuclease subunit S [Lachnospiraceae bacterium]